MGRGRRKQVFERNRRLAWKVLWSLDRGDWCSGGKDSVEVKVQEKGIKL